jgi:hypothetical protein
VDGVRGWMLLDQLMMDLVVRGNWRQRLIWLQVGVSKDRWLLNTTLVRSLGP